MIELFPDRYSRTQPQEAPGSPTEDAPPDPQLALFSAPQEQEKEAAQPRLGQVADTFLLDLLEDERTTNRHRETFFVSVIIHLLLVLLIATQPGLFGRLTQKS